MRDRKPGCGNERRRASCGLAAVVSFANVNAVECGAAIALAVVTARGLVERIYSGFEGFKWVGWGEGWDREVGRKRKWRWMVDGCGGCNSILHDTISQAYIRRKRLIVEHLKILDTTREVEMEMGG